jgi:tripartite-type tricarboxylate transporter receptor subunit TctC
MRRRQVLAGIAIGAVWPSVVRAQLENYPTRPVRIITDGSPGSNIDVGLRIVADRLTPLLGQQVLVLNHPGAGGSIAARIAAGSLADGYTLYIPALSAFAAIPGQAPNLPLEVPRDFAPIGMMAESPLAIVASRSLGVGTLAELITLAKEQPGAISYGTNGRGRLTHLTMELLQSRAGIKLIMVPYTGGATQALGDVMSGRVSLVIDGLGSISGAIQGDKVKALAVTTAERVAKLPDIPTVAESIPGFAVTGWQVLVAPVGTSEAIVNKLSDALQRVLREPVTREKLAMFANYPRAMSLLEVTEFVQAEQRLWRPVAERLAQGPQ